MFQEKTILPDLPHPYIERPRLKKLLDQSAKHRLTLVVAPVGYGKTSLVRAWLPSNIVWLNLDVQDNGQQHFIQHLIACLQSRFSSLEIDFTQAVDTVLVRIIEALQNADFRLVLDNGQAIHNEDIWDIISFLLTYLPTSINLIIISRQKPPLKLGLLRERRQVIEISTSLLKFSDEEISEVLKHSLQKPLSKTNFEILQNRLEGWIGGWQLAIMALQTTSIETLIEDFRGDHRFVADILFEEVLQHLPPEIIRFLENTSIVRVFTTELCDYLCQHDKSQQFINNLQKQYVFIFPLTQRQQVFRYHPLFADLLQHRLDKARKQQLHLRASQWYTTQGDGLSAVYHAQLTNDTDYLAHLIAKYGATTIMQGHIETFLGWMQHLPQPIIRQNPILALGQAWAFYFSERYADIPLYLEVAGTKLLTDSPESPAVTQRLLGEIQALQTYYLQWSGNFAEAIAHSKHVLAALKPEQFVERSLNHYFLALSLQQSGNLYEATTNFEQAIRLARHSGNPTGVAQMTYELALLYRQQGQDIKPIIQQAIDYVGNDHPLLVHIQKLADTQSLVETLSQRETEILQQVANGLSNQQIADTLFISLSTVKWHIGNIYGKLQVNRRTEAIMRAKVLGLLAP